MFRIVRASATLVMLLSGVWGASAQVPADIAAGLKSIGPIVDPACTAKLYRPLMPKNDYNSGKAPLYPGVTIARDQSFGPHPKDLLDIFTADTHAANLPVLIYVPGGSGNKIEQQVREANVFYDNIGRWAAGHGMVGVTVQRHPGANWDDPAKDISAAIQWVQAHVASYGGNPARLFIWAHSAGNGPVGTYVGRPEVWGPKGVGLTGAILMSGQWNVAPLSVPARTVGGMQGIGAAGSTCGAKGPLSTDGRIVGPSAASPDERPAAPGGQVDAETLVMRSTLPEYRRTKVALLLVNAEFDPGVDGAMSPFNQALHDDLCTSGPAHCPAMLLAKGQSHMSEVFSIDTADVSVSGAILAWMRSTP